MDGIRVWTARGPSGESYLAVFNITDKAKTVELALAQVGIAGTAGRDLWTGQSVSAPKGPLNLTLPPHASVLYAFRS